MANTSYYKLTRGQWLPVADAGFVSVSEEPGQAVRWAVTDTGTPPAVSDRGHPVNMHYDAEMTGTERFYLLGEGLVSVTATSPVAQS